MAQEQEIYKGHYIRITEQTGNDGHTYERAYVRPGIGIVIVTDELKLRFIQEFDWNSREVRIKLVTGYIEDRETPLECAIREINEELGLSADHWERFMVCISDEPTVRKAQTFFIARGIRLDGQPNPEPGEKIVGYVDYTPSKVREIVLQEGFGTGYQAFALLKFLETANMSQ